MVIVQSCSDFLVLSLGTGLHSVGYDARDDVAKWAIVDWLANKGGALVDMVFNASADMVDYNVSAFFQSQQCAPNYLRIQVRPAGVVSQPNCKFFSDPGR